MSRHEARSCAALAAAGVLAFLAACAGSGPPAPAPGPAVRELDPHLVAPATGYPLTVDRDLASRVDALWDRLRAGEDPEAILAAGRELRDSAPDLHPAVVLVAQAEFLRREDRRVLEALRPVADEHPDYLACQLLRGRAAERVGELVVAFEAFDDVASASELARERADELRPRAREIVSRRLEEALRRGQIEAAEAHLEWLERRVGDERTTLEATRRIRAATGDLEGELEAVCRLAEIEPGRELEQRCGALQIEVGDVRAGLAAFERLAAAFPEDSEIGEQLERAKFRWRLELLPPMVRDLGRQGELGRADLAALLYWLVPQVRYSQVIDPPIANDILDHPRHDEILRVVNLGLMQVDETLHRFDPGAPATRQTALAALLGLLGRSERRFACLAETTEDHLADSTAWVCDRAARCRLIPEAADCLPSAPISGGEALELFRRSLDLLGSEGP